ncbi:MAG TPA: hypothetical protein VH593_34585 [Ktedonobacteraceae bacterium]
MSEAIFLRLLAQEDKGKALVDAIETIVHAGNRSPFIYTVDVESFNQIPGSPFAYWVSEHIRRVFKKFPALEGDIAEARRGASTGDDFRRVRLWWEVPETMIGRFLRWASFAKGGSYSPFYSDIHLLADWDETRRTYRDFYGRPGREIERPEALEYYFRSGLTYPRRTTSGLSVRVMPEGCIFADKGPAIFVKEDEESVLLSLLALMQSEPFSALLKLQLGAATAAARSYEVGLIQQMPLPSLSSDVQERLARLAREAHDLKREGDRDDEVTHPFTCPTLVRLRAGATLQDALETLSVEKAMRQLQLAEIQHEIDEQAFALYGFSAEDRAQIRRSEADVASEGMLMEASTEEDEEVEETVPVSNVQRAQIAAADLLMYAVGCAFGRWDVRIGCQHDLAPLLADPVAPLPVCAPGALIGPDGLPAKSGGIVSEEWLRARPNAISFPPEESVVRSTIPDDEYPLPIAWQGILADDPNHDDDIVRRVRDVLELLWGDCAEAIEIEACAILGGRDLRDYFRNPRNFFDYHIGRYSKSRRKAPMYWLLQSPKKNYGLWLYYHRLDPDLLFKALTLYVLPKIRLEEARLEELSATRQGGGSAGPMARHTEQAIERQEVLLTDLREFRDRLERAAKHYFTPDRNDGVLLTIAPLWDLVPWKDARSAWEQLLAGKYGWSSIGKQLREKGLVQVI